jgi:hypothetical protein
MRLQRSSIAPLVAPAQVWGGLATEAQAGAIRLMARLASNLVIRGSDSTHKESTPCLHDPATPRSARSISTAAP